MDLLNRNLKKKITYLLDQFPVVILLGVRQCGKSTLARMLGQEWKYYDLERPAYFDLIDKDPLLFFRENENQIIIDEAQCCPGIFPVLKSIIDEDRHKNGRFILTGSSSFELVKGISESLAGRAALVEVSPFKMNEVKKEKLGRFYTIFEKKISPRDLDDLRQLTSVIKFGEIKYSLLKGGYPQPILQDKDNYHSQWMENYFHTYINRDMRALFPSMDILKYRRVIQMLANVSGTIINNSEMARSVQTSEKSVRDYLQIVSGTFVWRQLPAYKTSKIKTTISSSKGHYRDSGLFFYLQNIFSLKELDIYPKLGHAFESFIIEEIIRGIQASRAVNFTPYHFRTKSGGEIDLILEGSFGLLPIEIKYNSYTPKKVLTAMTNFIDKHQLPYGIVVNNCDSPSMITEKIIQIPAGCI